VKQVLKVMMLFGLLTLLLSACTSSIKTLETWKDDSYTGSLETVLVIAAARDDFIRKQIENVLVNQLAKQGVEAVAGHKVFADPEKSLERETVLKKVKELGVANVLVMKSVMHESREESQAQGIFVSPSATYRDGWYSYYAGSVVMPEKKIDTDYFTVSTTLFDVSCKKPVWSDLTQIKISGTSKQGAVNLYTPLIIERLQQAQLLK